MSIQSVTSSPLRAKFISLWLAQPVNRTADQDKSLGQPETAGKGASNHQNVADLTGILLSTISGSGKALPEPNDPIKTHREEKRQQSLKSAASKIRAGNAEDGRKELQEYLRSTPTDTTALRFVGHSYLEEGDYRQALSHYRKALKADTGDPLIAGDIAAADALQQSDNEAISQARRRLQSPHHQYQGLRILFRVTERSPESAKAYLALADGFLASGNHSQSITALEKAITHADNQSVDDAVSHARSIADRSPHNGDAAAALGRALHTGDETSHAIRQLTAALQLDRTNASTARSLATAYGDRAIDRAREGDLIGARSDIAAAKEADPVAPNLNEAMAAVAARQAKQDVADGHYARALASLRDIGSIIPENESVRQELRDALMLVGAHYRSNNNDAAAYVSFQRALALDPDSSPLRQRLGDTAHAVGMRALNARDYDRAIEKLQLAYDTYRPDKSYGRDLASAFNQRAQFHVARGDLTRALLDFRSGFAIDSTNSDLNTNYAKAVDQYNATA